MAALLHALLSPSTTRWTAAVTTSQVTMARSRVDSRALALPGVSGKEKRERGGESVDVKLESG